MNINKEEAKKQLEKLQKDADNLKAIINTPYKDWRSLTSFEKCCHDERKKELEKLVAKGEKFLTEKDQYKAYLKEVANFAKGGQV